MSMSRRSVETLIDLIENKIATMLVYDREDARELATLEHARRELTVLRGGHAGQAAPARLTPLRRALAAVPA